MPNFAKRQHADNASKKRVDRPTQSRLPYNRASYFLQGHIAIVFLQSMAFNTRLMILSLTSHSQHA
jgi:hypothetical protein